ncbi:uncharacterized protein PRCAT00003524001 [Priceomyces carsonii]|uniref:uncharacterized protein n=1 Tax=Priceomyces carsonii TaxID=28549 RepID=UPI002EDBB0F5|nr:unnamed protein product [Priceomyces carsonii]
MTIMESKASSLNKGEVVIEETTATDDFKQHDNVDMSAVNNHDIALKQIIKARPISNFSNKRIKLYLVCVCLYLCATMSGYDGSLMTSINTLPEYLDYFNLENTASGTGLVFSIYPIGSMCATCLVWLADYIGRVPAIAVGLIILVAGAILSAATSNHDAFIAARFFISFGSTIAITAAPAYMMEVLPPNMKILALFYNTFYYIGSIIATWTMYGTSIRYQGTHKSFTIALWLQLLCPGLVLSCIWLFPESPRYYYSKNKIDKAKSFIVKYHANGDENHPLVSAELDQMAQSFAESGFLKPRDYLDFSIFLKSRALKKRTLLVILWSWICQYSGNQVITYYMTTLFLNLGVTNATTRLLLTAVNSIICFLTASAGALTVERLGRRPVLMYACVGFVISFIALAISTKAFSDNSDNKMAAQVGIAFIYIFQAVFFSFAFTPLQPTYPSEILSNEMRARGLALWHLVSNAASTLNLYTAPLAMEKITYWYYVFFVFWDLLELIVIYFMFVETSGLSLEEIEHVFTVKGSVKESIRLSKASRSSDTECVEDALGQKPEYSETRV